MFLSIPFGVTSASNCVMLTAKKLGRLVELILAFQERVAQLEQRLKELEGRVAESQEQTVWFSLWDKVCNLDNLSQAMLEVILNGGSAGVDGQTTGQISEKWTKEQERLQSELLQGQYLPQPARRVWISKPGTSEQRPLGVPVVRDRVVQAALRHVLEPIFERDFAEQSSEINFARNSAVDAAGAFRAS